MGRGVRGGVRYERQRRQRRQAPPAACVTSAFQASCLCFCPLRFLNRSCMQRWHGIMQKLAAAQLHLCLHLSCLPAPLLQPHPFARCSTAQAQVAIIPQRYRPDAQKAEEAVQAAAGAAAGLDQKFGELKKAAKNAYDRIYYGDVLPPVGSFQISYARCVPGYEKGSVCERCMPALPAAGTGWAVLCTALQLRLLGLLSLCRAARTSGRLGRAAPVPCNAGHAAGWRWRTCTVSSRRVAVGAVFPTAACSLHALQQRALAAGHRRWASRRLRPVVSHTLSAWGAPPHAGCCNCCTSGA